MLRLLIAAAVLTLTGCRAVGAAPDPWRCRLDFERALRESVLFADTTADEGFHFLWLPSFHRSVGARLQRHGDEFRLRTVRVTSVEACSEQVEVVDRKVSRASWEKLQSLLTEAGYFDEGRPGPRRNVTEDGAQWTFHVFNREQRRTVVLDSSDMSDEVIAVHGGVPEQLALRNAAVLVLDLGGLRLPHMY